MQVTTMRRGHARPTHVRSLHPRKWGATRMCTSMWAPQISGGGQPTEETPGKHCTTDHGKICPPGLRMSSKMSEPIVCNASNATLQRSTNTREPFLGKPGRPTDARSFHRPRKHVTLDGPQEAQTPKSSEFLKFDCS